jgi:DNA (cytosine-5)-methyltransferase 1
VNYIDLFAGAGGLSEGFIKQGFSPIAHVEMDIAACYTMRTRLAYYYLKDNNRLNDYKKYLKGEISRNQLYSLIPAEILNSVINLQICDENNDEIFSLIDYQLKGKETDIIIGGPPCQAYSLVGRARDKNGMKGDKRNYLYLQYAKYLIKYYPKLFVFENVLGLKSADGGRYLHSMKALFKEIGYETQVREVEAKDFGVLQNRKRIIIMGWRVSLNINIPAFQNIEIRSCKVEDLLFDLPKLKAGSGIDKYMDYTLPANAYLNQTHIRNGLDVLTQHIARPHTNQDKEIYRIAVSKWEKNKERLNYNDLPDSLKTHQNRHSFFDRFKVVAAELPYSQTIVAHISKDGHYYIHPDINQNRSLSVREAARIQSFPDDYYFEGTKETENRTPAFKQIGNAVPPLLAEKIAGSLKYLSLNG